ncbi:hypothetical protein CHISP_3720 [Chitinispirillum alkaliphilum]|nr:hypothetical protein CHISP_3720 [Chitinispirillum alkaliphilum]
MLIFGIVLIFIGILEFVSWLNPYGIKIFGIEMKDHYGIKSKRKKYISIILIVTGLTIVFLFIPINISENNISIVQCIIENKSEK